MAEKPQFHMAKPVLRKSKKPVGAWIPTSPARPRLAVSLPGGFKGTLLPFLQSQTGLKFFSFLFANVIFEVDFIPPTNLN